MLTGNSYKSESMDSEFYVPIPLPYKDRPVGVSGLMRVKDEEEYVEASIDSVIDVLDELIICYQECSDDTPNILKRKQQEYPDKIKLYYYAPTVYAHNLTPEEYEYAYNLPDDSPNLLSGYYNYTLSKATYRYAVKIDADQIYFTDEMKQLCDAYRSDKKMKLSWQEKLAGKCLPPPSMLFTWKKRVCIHFLSLIGNFETYYWQFVLKTITNEKCIAFLSGIQLHRIGEELFAGTGDRYGGKASFYNGTEDLCFFEITSDTYYYLGRGSSFCHSLIEAFYIGNGMRLYAGFMWFHMRGCKKAFIKYNVKLKPVSYEWFKRVSSQKLKHTGIGAFSKKYEVYFSFFHDYFKLPDIHKIIK
ncbi:hypothetical protein [Parabacteroides bouchesdurhonensis]|uniref:hypothetical protein n=1 Tax=Parabacteroides bouchesdurhonensis TaxID=1936995 RepID=UPI000C837828|nr:hypothetical protein [Parabacteroides bouchesdurhonensis]